MYIINPSTNDPLTRTHSWMWRLLSWTSTRRGSLAERGSWRRRRLASGRLRTTSKTNKSNESLLPLSTLYHMATADHLYRTIASIKSKSLPSRRAELASAEKESVSLNDTCADLHQRVRASRGQVEEARSALQAHRSRGQVLRALVEQRENGALPGIHGRLVRGEGGGV